MTSTKKQPKGKDSEYRTLKRIRLSEVSLVDTPAQGEALVSICKRKKDDHDTEIAKGSRAISTMTAGHAHSIVMVGYGGDKLVSGTTSYVDGHAHDWVMDDAGNVILADAMGHTHGISVLVKNNSEDGSTTSEDATVDSTPAEPIGKQTDRETMSDQTKNAPAEGTVSKADHDALQKRASRFEAIVGLSPEHRAHFDGLSGSAADDFLAKSASGRDELIKAADAADPVVYTTRTGVELRKSAGQSTIDLAKENDDLAKSLAAANEERLEKRAGDFYKNLRGELTAKVALLKAVEGIEDADVRKAVEEMLKAHDAGLAKAFTRAGTADAGPEPEGDSPADQLDALAKRYVEEHDGVDEATAYDAVLKTTEGAKLYAQHTGRA